MAYCFLGAAQDAGGDALGVVPGTVGLGFVGIGLAIVRVAEIRGVEDIGEFVSLDIARLRDDGTGVADPAVRVSGEGEIRIDHDAAHGLVGGFDSECDADGAGPVRDIVAFSAGGAIPGGVAVLGEAACRHDLDMAAIDRGFEADPGYAIQAVIPVEAFEAVIGTENASVEAGPGDGARERLGVGRFEAVGHSEAVGGCRNGGGLSAVVVELRDVRAPGTECGGRRFDVDAGLAGLEPVLEGRHRSRLRRHGPEDRVQGCLAHFDEERRFDDFLACGQDELQFGAVVDINADGPVGGCQRGEAGESEMQDETVEVQVGVVEGVAAVSEDADAQAPPGLDADGPAEEVAPFQLLSFRRRVRQAFKDDGQGIVAGGGFGGLADGGDVVVGGEPDDGAMRPGRPVIP